MNKKVQAGIKGSAIALTALLLTACAGTNSRIDALETKVGQLEQEVAAANSGASNAASAMQAAEAAQATADEALVIAVAGQECCDATNEKIDRMFQRSQSK